MDKIAQSMRFSPNPSVVFRNRKPELAFGENQRKFTTQGQSRGTYNHSVNATTALNCPINRRENAPGYDVPEPALAGSAILTKTGGGSRQ